MNHYKDLTKRINGKLADFNKNIPDTMAGFGLL
ncbi:MAG: hypothetical protein ACI93R_003653, partial [Flavobacteriales bacterium]